MKLKLALLGIAAALTAAVLTACSIAYAQSMTATLNWTAPTAYTNGTAIPSGTAITYNVYRGAASGAETLLTSGVTADTYVDSAVSPGATYYYEITAVIDGQESAKSNEASKTFAPLVPAAPAGLTVQ